MQFERLLKDDAVEEMGERARMHAFEKAISMAAIVKSTLGLEGMNKMLQDNGSRRSSTITNDGATILNADISKTQDDEVGDRTTLDYLMVLECARNALLEKVMDNKQDEEKFNEDLMKIAMTTLSSTIFSQDKEHFAKLAVGAVTRLNGSTNLETIQIIKKPGGSLIDSFLHEGFILDKKNGVGQPKRITCGEKTTKKQTKKRIMECKLIEAIRICDDKLKYFSGVANGQPCSIVLRGASPQMLDEAERTLLHALYVLSQIANDSRVLFGGRWPKVMAKAVDKLARKTPGKEVIYS